MLLAVALVGLGFASAGLPAAFDSFRDLVHDTETSCLSLKTADSCRAGSDEETGEQCVWCSWLAVPSECLSSSLAKVDASGVQFTWFTVGTGPWCFAPTFV